MKIKKVIKNFTLKNLGDFGEYCLYRISLSRQKHYSDYQPLPWIGKEAIKRSESTVQRWEAMKAEIKIDYGSAMDIGCNLGYFVLQLAEMGFFSIGIDSQYQFQAISQYAKKKAGLHNAGFYTVEISASGKGVPAKSKYFSETTLYVKDLPKVDVVIFLAVWHLWINAYGFDEAREMLQML